MDNNLDDLFVDDNEEKINNEGIDMSDNKINIDEEVFRQNYAIMKPKLLVFGVGGGGSNAVNYMYNSHDIENVDFIVANTDMQDLRKSPVSYKIQLGPKRTKGLGAGMNPKVAEEAALESEEEIAKALEDVTMLFITAGMGGGTGSGAAPIVAKMAQERGILTVAVVTKPFDNEGEEKAEIAEKAVEELQKYVDTLIVIPNQSLYTIANENTLLSESYQKANSVLNLGVKGITDLITKQGFVNLDFADIRSVMEKKGKSMIGMGVGTGENRTKNALDEAIRNPLLENSSIKGATGIIVNITSSPDFTLYEYDEVLRRIKEESGKKAKIIPGNSFDENLKDTVRISIFATGIENNDEEKEDENPEKTEDDFDFGNDVHNEQEDYFDINSKIQQIDLEDQYDFADRNPINNEYNREARNNDYYEKQPSGFKKLFSHLFSNGNKKQNNQQIDIEDYNYDNIDIDSYKKFVDNINMKNKK